MKKKFLSLWAIILVASLVLTACGGGDDPTDNPRPEDAGQRAENVHTKNPLGSVVGDPAVTTHGTSAVDPPLGVPGEPAHHAHDTTTNDVVDPGYLLEE